MNSTQIKEKIKEVKNLINSTEMLELKKNNEENFVSEIKSKFNDFSENYPGIFEKILDNSIEDIQFSLMLEMLDKIQNNQMSEHDASVKVGESLVNKYVKPVIGSDSNKSS